MDRWYVVQTHAKAETKALQHLRNQGFRAYLPCYAKRRRHARRVESVLAPLFPGYLFIGMDVARTRWRSIRSTIGVRTLICQGEMPAAVPDGVVEDIRAHEDGSGLVPVKPQIAFEPGDTVTVTDGPLREQVGWFQCMADDERVVILLNLLGRQMRVPLPLDAVRAFA